MGGAQNSAARRSSAISVLSAAALLLCNLATAQQPQLSFNGRFQPNSNGAAFPQRFGFASTTVYVPFSGENITVALAGVGGRSQLELRVDSKLLESASTDTSEPKNITIPFLGSGMHTLAITKITEALFGEAQLLGVYTASGASLGSRRVLVPGRRMEIIGASVMNGFGNLGLTQGCSDLAAAQDSLLAVGPLTATHFGARFTQLAWTGAGILTPGAAPQQTQQQQGQVAASSTGGGSGRGPTIPELYARALPDDAGSQWSAASFVPQVVLVEAGGNDFSNGSAPPDWQAAYKAFLQQVRSNAPDAYIVVLALPGSVGAAIRGAAANSAYIGNLTTAVKDLQDGGFQRLTFLQLPSSVVQDAGGCAGHPSMDTHARMADVVQATVGNLTGWTATNTKNSFLWRVDGGR